MIPQHGIQAMCSQEANHQGRFRRLFPELNPNYTNPHDLASLGKPTGPMDGGTGRNSSSSIPMGFVFFGQFIDHDITLDTTSALDRVNDPNATQNFRTPALDLDSIYGAGPEASAFLYKDGLYLLTAEDGTALASQSTAHAKHDVVRTSEGTAIIGDPRNDENRVISQLQLGFINFHNEVVKHVINEEGYSTTDLKRGSLRKEIFEKSRELVTWHYHWVVLYEFLPHIAGDDVVREVLGEGRKFYTPKRAYIPIEFSTAAYRFGHSLTPQKLKVRLNQSNDFELFGRTLGFGFQPISKNEQIVEWGALLDIDAASLNQRTDKLDTKMPSDLLDLPFIREGEKSLATRNLQRGQSFLIPSGERVAEAIGVSQSDMNIVSSFIQSVTGGIDLSNGTPLWFYILAEAEAIGKRTSSGTLPGEGLGPAGAAIICETLIGLLELDSMSFLGSNRNWTPTLNSRSNTFTLGDLLTYRA